MSRLPHLAIEKQFFSLCLCVGLMKYSSISSQVIFCSQKKNNELFGNHEKEIVATVLAVSATNPPLVNNFENLLHYKLLSLFTR